MIRRRDRLYYLVYLAYLGIYWDTVFSGEGKSLGGSFYFSMLRVICVTETIPCEIKA